MASADWSASAPNLRRTNACRIGSADCHRATTSNEGADAPCAPGPNSDPPPPCGPRGSPPPPNPPPPGIGGPPPAPPGPLIETLTDFAHGELVIIFVASFSLHSVYGFCQKSAASRPKPNKRKSPAVFFIARISGLSI